MARVPYLDPEDLDPDDRDVLSRPINLARVLAHSPAGSRAFSRLGGWIRFTSKLDPRLREMAILRVGVLARSDYEYSHHIKIGREFGLTDADIRSVIDGPDSPALGEIERLVLTATDEATVAGAISEATFEALAVHLDGELLVELTLVISFYNAVVRFLASLAIDVEPEYLTYLGEFPLEAESEEHES